MAAGLMVAASGGTRALYIGGNLTTVAVDTVLQLRDDLTGWDHVERLRLPRPMSFFAGAIYEL